MTFIVIIIIDIPLVVFSSLLFSRKHFSQFIFFIRCIHEYDNIRGKWGTAYDYSFDLNFDTANPPNWFIFIMGVGFWLHSELENNIFLFGCSKKV